MADNTKMVKAYIAIRDARDAARHAWEAEDEKFKAKLGIIESGMLKHLLDTKTDSVATPVGTFYKQLEMTPAGSDWDVIYKWIEKHDAFEMLERRIKRTFIKEYAEAHNGAIPPGVTVHKEYVVRVRRGK